MCIHKERPYDQICISKDKLIHKKTDINNVNYYRGEVLN